MPHDDCMPSISFTPPAWAAPAPSWNDTTPYWRSVNLPLREYPGFPDPSLADINQLATGPDLLMHERRETVADQICDQSALKPWT